MSIALIAARSRAADQSFSTEEACDDDSPIAGIPISLGALVAVIENAVRFWRGTFEVPGDTGA